MSAFTGKQAAPSQAPPKSSAAENLKGVKHKIIVMSGKGGVGKSTVAVNLAAALAKRGKRVGLLDADMHGPSVPKLLGLPNLPLSVDAKGKIVPYHVPPSIKVVSIAFLLSDRDSPVIWRGPVKMGAIKQFLEEVEWGELDYLLVDLPPGTGDEPLSTAQLVPSPDGAVIVTTPQDVALLSVRKSINFAKAVGLRPIGLVENMYGLKCPHCGKDIPLFEDGGVAKATKDLSIPLLGKLPLSPEIARSGDDGKPFAAGSDDDARAFDEITSKIMKAVEGSGG
ncbi:MAG: Mrp/NBP35 family ATP-binding protein [Candidatus Thermoplasmatota archaeon]